GDRPLDFADVDVRLHHRRHRLLDAVSSLSVEIISRGCTQIYADEKQLKVNSSICANPRLSAQCVYFHTRLISCACIQSSKIKECTSSYYSLIRVYLREFAAA